MLTSKPRGNKGKMKTVNLSAEHKRENRKKKQRKSIENSKHKIR